MSRDFDNFMSFIHYTLCKAKAQDQLDEYLESDKGLKNRTSFVYYNTKKEKLEKVIKKMKDKYRKEGKSVLRDLGSDFKFVRVVEEEY